MNKLDLASGWAKAWSVISTGNEKLIAIATVIGILLVVGSIVGYLWERRRGSGGNHKSVFGMLAVGAILVAPTVVFPLLLMVVDAIANSVLNLFSVGG